jgi:CcmD family protein
LVKRRVLVCVCALSLVAGLRVDARQQEPAAPATQPAPQAAQNEFVPVKDLPAAEQIAAGPLVLGAYGFIWAVVLVYVFLLSRRLQAVQKDIDALKRQARN